MKKYKITSGVYGLNYFRSIINLSNQIEIIRNLEIDPFQKFSIEYSATYWYLQYHLLRDGHVLIEKEEIDADYKTFFEEENLNFIWIDILDKSNYEIKCMDGAWYVEVFNEDTNKIVQQHYNQWLPF